MMNKDKQLIKEEEMDDSNKPLLQTTPNQYGRNENRKYHNHPGPPAATTTNNNQEPPRFPLEFFRHDENDRLASNLAAAALPPWEASLLNLKTPTPPSAAAFFPRDVPPRGPLKKRPTSPIPVLRTAGAATTAAGRAASNFSPVAPPPRPLVAQSSLNSIVSCSSTAAAAAAAAPLLRASSSTFSVYPHHQHLPPQLCLTSSCGRQLMSEPLLATPNHVGMTPRSSSSAGSQHLVAPVNVQAAAATAAGGQPPSVAVEPAVKQEPSQEQRTVTTPGLDLLAEQVVNSGHHEVVYPVPVTAPRTKETKRLPAALPLHHRIRRSVAYAASDRHLPPSARPDVPHSSTGEFIGRSHHHSDESYSSYYGYPPSYPHPPHRRAYPPHSYQYEYEYPPASTVHARVPERHARSHVHKIPPSMRKDQAAAPLPVRHKATSRASASARTSIRNIPSVPYLPPEDPVLTLPTLFAEAPKTRKACRCGNSKCLKLYCECFRSGALCDSKLCRCTDCKNNEMNNKSEGARGYAILNIMAKRPDAFHFKVKRRSGKSCSCQKSNCLKKYCECLAQGRQCSDVCKCLECKNIQEDDEDP